MTGKDDIASRCDRRYFMPTHDPKISTQEISTHDGLTIASLRQRDIQANCNTRVLCLHGWLDNANSFVPMMPYLPDMDLVAIDLPGHGHSSHLQGAYSVLDTAVRCLDIANALEWDTFHVIGHSLGGSIALMMAVAAPQRIVSATSIESAGPLTEAPSKFSERLQKAADDRAHRNRYASRHYESRDQAIDARLKAAKMNRLSAELIIRRQVQEYDGKWTWRFDSSLRNQSLAYLHEAQVEAALAAIECRTHVVIASDGYMVGRDETASRLGQIKQLEITELPGHHHLHMDTPEPVAAAINRFLGTQPALGG